MTYKQELTKRLGSYKSVQLMIVVGLVSVAEMAWSAPCEAEVHRAFHFLLGEWVVHSEDGKLQGENSITLEENGCLIVERWRGAKGSTGQSYNYVQPESQQWHQLWVSQGAVIDYKGGLTEAGAMHLEGQIIYQAQGQTLPFHGTWTPLEDGRVLQELKQFNPQTKQFDNWFVGFYSRKQPDAATK